ncbi:hypothetical protein SB761_34385, partial [Pseudomonas sp. SIMBA_064]
VMTNILGFGTAIDFSTVAAASWFGLPSIHTPRFEQIVSSMVSASLSLSSYVVACTYSVRAISVC